MERGTLSINQPFSLGLTLLCGQCFRWEGPDQEGWFTGIAGQAYWRLKQTVNLLEWECSSLRVREIPSGDWIYRYLGLDDNLNAWIQSYENHPVISKPLKILKGLRIINQEPWECLISYLFAQGLSVTVIQSAVKKFCEKYGRPILAMEGKKGFPEAADLTMLTAEILKPFTNNNRARADRIIRISRAVQAKVISLNHLKEIPCDEARESLMLLDGIGPKIADCILLFSLGQESAFPVDRWVLRAMKRHFPKIRVLGRSHEAPTRSEYIKIVQKARKAFGLRCGIASEYLFLYLRMQEDEKLRKGLSLFCQEVNF